MSHRWLMLAALCVATPAFAEVTPLPEEVTAVVDSTAAGTIACVETEDGGDIRGGWWKTSDPDDVELCELLTPAGTYVDPAACNHSNGATIVGRADGGLGGFTTEVPVFCRSGATTQLTYLGNTPFEGHADVCSRNGKRIWGALLSGGFWFPMLWDDTNTILWDSALDASWVGNFFPGITAIQFTGCSDDGRYACGWYEWNGGPDRFPFVIDSEDPVSAFEDCFGGLTQTDPGEARCVSGEGSVVVVWQSDSDETFVTESEDPTANLDKISDGQPKFCNEDGTTVVGFETQGGDDIGWVWKDGEAAEIAPTGDFKGTLPTAANRDCSVVCGTLQNGADTSYLWKDGVHGEFSSLTACRDSIDLPFTGYVFDSTSCVNEGGRTFYCTGEYPGGDATCFYCKLESGPRFVWNESARVYPPFVSEYTFYAYYYGIYANAFGSTSYIQVGASFLDVAYQYDAPCRDIDYDYWQRAGAVDDYEGLRYTQFIYEYYGYLYLYYGQQGDAPVTQYLQLAQAYALYGCQVLLEEL